MSRTSAFHQYLLGSEVDGHPNHRTNKVRQIRPKAKKVATVQLVYDDQPNQIRTRIEAPTHSRMTTLRTGTTDLLFECLATELTPTGLWTKPVEVAHFLDLDLD